jgi:acetyltransferase-like isoleucine patch superfamily enzyme
MRIVDEIGLKKTSKFIVYSFLEAIYRLCFLPPLRKIFLVLLGAKIGKHSILMNVNFFNWHYMGLAGLKIGDECFIGDETLIDLYDQVILEDQVTIAQRVTVLTHLNVGYKNHPLQKFFPKMSKPVIFKRGSVVGAAAKILPGVTIGERSFVGAGAVVTSNIPKESVYAGVPAKLIRKIK